MEQPCCNFVMAEGDFARAVELLTQAMEMEGPSATSLAARADALLKAKRPLAAIADCDAALLFNPTSAKAHRCRGRALAHKGRWDESQQSLETAQTIDFDPDTEPLRAMVQRRIDAEDDARLAAGLEEARARRTAESARRRVRREQEAQEQEAEQRQRDEWMRWEQLAHDRTRARRDDVRLGMVMQMIRGDSRLMDALQRPHVAKAFDDLVKGFERIRRTGTMQRSWPSWLCCVQMWT